MREEIRKNQNLPKNHSGVNLIPTPENDIWTPPILQVIKGRGSKKLLFIPVTEGAIITSLFNELKRSGILPSIYRDINPTPENTRLAEKSRRHDIIVLTGFDEGGTLPGTRARLAPFRRTADCGLGESVPVMAGGITDNHYRPCCLCAGSGVSLLVPKGFVGRKEMPCAAVGKG